MSSKRVVVLDSGYDSYASEKEILKSGGYELDIFPGTRKDRESKIRFARGAIGAFIRLTEIDEEFLSRVPGLRVLVRYGVGYDNVDLKALKRHGGQLSNVTTYANHSVSDHALAMLLSCARRLTEGNATFPSHYTNPPDRDIIEIKEMTVGIIGLGNIGGTFCQKIKPLVKRVLATDPYIAPDRFEKLQAEPVDLPTLFQRCDVISLHCNLTAETHHILDEAAFKQMVKRPIIINAARGAMIDLRALRTALDEDRLHSVGLDVYDVEPPDDDIQKLLSHPSIIKSGHYAWYSRQSMRNVQILAARNMLGLLKGEPVKDEIK